MFQDAIHSHQTIAFYQDILCRLDLQCPYYIYSALINIVFSLHFPCFVQQFSLYVQPFFNLILQDISYSPEDTTGCL